MPAYLVSLPTTLVGRQLQNGVDACVVFAADAGDAKAMAKAAMGADNNAAWTNADVTTIAAASDILGFRFVVKETLPSGAVGRTCDITATGAGQDTIDEIGTAIATALGGGAAYNSTSQKVTLTASGSGNNSIEVSVYPPSSVGQDAPIPGFVTATTHNGSAGSELSFVLAADAFVVPALIGRCTLR